MDPTNATAASAQLKKHKNSLFRNVGFALLRNVGFAMTVNSPTANISTYLFAWLVENKGNPKKANKLKGGTTSGEE